MPKLTLRDLFAVVTIVAILIAWWLDRSRLAAENRSMRSLYRYYVLFDGPEGSLDVYPNVKARRERFDRAQPPVAPSDYPKPLKPLH
jgi:hypothetical protein